MTRAQALLQLAIVEIRNTAVAALAFSQIVEGMALTVIHECDRMLANEDPIVKFSSGIETPVQVDTSTLS